MKRPAIRSAKSRAGAHLPLFAAALATIAILLGAPGAHAAPDAVLTASPAGTTTPNKLAVVLGLGSPWGELGVSYQRQLRPSLALETGVGLGATGLQLAVLPKLLIGSGAARLYLEGGPSLTLSDEAGAGLWAAGEVGFESTFNSWTLGFGAGASILAAGEVRVPICFVGDCSNLQPGTWLPEIRLVVGRNF